jgi:hypothetical protein
MFLVDGEGIVGLCVNIKEALKRTAKICRDLKDIINSFFIYSNPGDKIYEWY